MLEEQTRQPLSDMNVFLFPVGSDKPILQWRTDVDPRDTVADGSFRGSLPVGEWEIAAHRHGRPTGERRRITVTEGAELHVALESPRPGLLTFTVRDQDGLPIPAKVTLFPVQGEPARNPDLGDGFISGMPEWGRPEMVLFPLYGDGAVELPDGQYYAVASRGLEYEIDVSEPFVIDAERRQRLDFVLQRSVNTDGWVSADFHVHASPSHDSGVQLHDRVRTMACEGVEFFSSTDHDFITDYAPIIEDLGVEEFVQSAVGLETTTIEVGHFLTFPLQADFLGHAGGAIDWTDLPPEDITDELYAMGRRAGFESVVFVGHPRDGILGYFDQFGFDPYASAPGSPEQLTPVLRPSVTNAANPILRDTDNFSLEFDALELLNGKRMDYIRTPTQPELDTFSTDPDNMPVYEWMSRTLEEQDELDQGVYRLGYGIEGQVDDWFTLLNLGFRFTALGNSDTHGWTSIESGCPRNFVVSSTDDPAFIDDQQIANKVRRHEVIASYGPFLRFWIEDGGIGSDVRLDGGPATLTVDLQAATWIDVDRVEVYENGTLIHVWEGDDLVHGDVLRLAESLEISPTKDSWYVVLAMGDGTLSPVFTPVEIPYVPLDEVVTEALSGIEAVGSLLSPATPFPKVYDVHPFAMTNPIWVDADGDGTFEAPGLPDWLEPPIEPVAR